MKIINFFAFGDPKKTSRRRWVLCVGIAAQQNTNDTNRVNYIHLLVKPTYGPGTTPAAA